MIATGELVDTLLAWLNARHAPAGVTIDADTPLFASGIVDSIKVFELLAWTERAIGRRVDDSEITLDNFRTPRRIAAVFGCEVNDARS